MSSAKSRSSSYFVKVHCIPILLPAVTCRDPVDHQQEVRWRQQTALGNGGLYREGFCQLPIMDDLAGGVFIQSLDDGDERRTDESAEEKLWPPIIRPLKPRRTATVICFSQAKPFTTASRLSNCIIHGTRATFTVNLEQGSCS